MLVFAFFFLKRGITFTHYAAIFSFDLISQMFSKSIQIDLLHLKKKKHSYIMFHSVSIIIHSAVSLLCIQAVSRFGF